MPGLGDLNFLGPIAGIVTSVLWTMTSIFFSVAGRRIGSTVVNATRIALAIILLALIHRFVISESGSWIPAVQSKQLWLLALSGVIGLAIGDQCLFTAFVDIGPRLSNLLMTTAPVFAAVLSWVFLGEVLSLVAWIGMAITIGGIAWVILERGGQRSVPAPHRVRGVILAVAGGFCQAAGLMLSKAGMGHGWLADEQHLDPQAATLVRMVFAGVGVLPILVIARSRFAPARRVARIGRPATGFAFVVVGTMVGPVLGVWMSLVAADATDVGIAQTLLSLTPIFILPYAAFIEREHVSWRAIVGAVIAVIGVAVLFGEA
ncbi:MAG: DMT family transporter [Planctomycetes bacterium]|nr:DMT family transporter [Planctomycetota bacterium]